MRWLRSDAARAVPPSPSPSASDVAATLSRKSRRVVVTLRLAKGEAILARAEATTFRRRPKRASRAGAYAGRANADPDLRTIAVAHAAGDTRPRRFRRDAGARGRWRPHERRDVRRLRRGREQQRARAPRADAARVRAHQAASFERA